MDYELTYSEMASFKTYGDRLAYLSLAGKNHVSPRTISYSFYKTRPWLQVREEVIKRDLGCDLGVLSEDIEDVIIVHHINPVTEDDIRNWSPKLLDPENLITTSIVTHNKIHYGSPTEMEIIERTPGDTNLW